MPTAFALATANQSVSPSKGASHKRIGSWLAFYTIHSPNLQTTVIALVPVPAADPVIPCFIQSLPIQALPVLTYISASAHLLLLEAVSTSMPPCKQSASKVDFLKSIGLDNSRPEDKQKFQQLWVSFIPLSTRAPGPEALQQCCTVTVEISLWKMKPAAPRCSPGCYRFGDANRMRPTQCCDPHLTFIIMMNYQLISD